MDRNGARRTALVMGLAMPVLAAARMGAWETMDGGNGEMWITKTKVRGRWKKKTRTRTRLHGGADRGRTWTPRGKEKKKRTQSEWKTKER